MAYIAIKLADVIHKSEESIIKAIVKILDNLEKEDSEYVAIVESKLLNSVINVASTKAKTSLGLVDTNKFEVASLTTNKTEVEQAINTALNVDKIYSDLVSMASVVTYDDLARYATRAQVSELTTKYAELNTTVSDLFNNMDLIWVDKEEFEQAKAEMLAHIEAVRAELAALITSMIEEVRTELSTLIEDTTTSLTNKIDRATENLTDSVNDAKSTLSGEISSTESRLNSSIDQAEARLEAELKRQNTNSEE